MALLSLSVLLYSWCRIVLPWITSFLLFFQCVRISLFAGSIFQSGAKYYLIWCVCMDFLLYSLFISLWSPFSLFVSFERFSAFLCLFVFFSSSFFPFCFSQRVSQFWFTHFSSSSFLCFPLKNSIIKLHQFVHRHATIGANQVGYQYKNQN